MVLDVFFSSPQVLPVFIDVTFHPQIIKNIINQMEHDRAKKSNSGIPIIVKRNHSKHQEKADKINIMGCQSGIIFMIISQVFGKSAKLAGFENFFNFN